MRCRIICWSARAGLNVEGDLHPRQAGSYPFTFTFTFTATSHAQSLRSRCHLFFPPIPLYEEEIPTSGRSWLWGAVLGTPIAPTRRRRRKFEANPHIAFFRMTSPFQTLKALVFTSTKIFCLQRRTDAHIMPLSHQQQHNALHKPRRRRATGRNEGRR